MARQGPEDFEGQAANDFTTNPALDRNAITTGFSMRQCDFLHVNSGFWGLDTNPGSVWLPANPFGAWNHITHRRWLTKVGSWHAEAPYNYGPGLTGTGQVTQGATITIDPITNSYVVSAITNTFTPPVIVLGSPVNVVPEVQPPFSPYSNGDEVITETEASYSWDDGSGYTGFVDIELTDELLRSGGGTTLVDILTTLKSYYGAASLTGMPAGRYAQVRYVNNQAYDIDYNSAVFPNTPFNADFFADPNLFTTLSLYSGYSRSVIAATLAAAGSGYVAGETLTVSGGTLTFGGAAAQIQIDEVSGGGAILPGRFHFVQPIFPLSPPTSGQYCVFPSSPASVTGGSGTGAQFNLTATNGDIQATLYDLFYGDAPTNTLAETFNGIPFNLYAGITYQGIGIANPHYYMVSRCQWNHAQPVSLDAIVTSDVGIESMTPVDGTTVNDYDLAVYVNTISVSAYTGPFLTSDFKIPFSTPNGITAANFWVTSAPAGVPVAEMINRGIFLASDPPPGSVTFALPSGASITIDLTYVVIGSNSALAGRSGTVIEPSISETDDKLDMTIRIVHFG